MCCTALSSGLCCHSINLGLQKLGHSVHNTRCCSISSRSYRCNRRGYYPWSHSGAIRLFIVPSLRADDVIGCAPAMTADPGPVDVNTGVTTAGVLVAATTPLINEVNYPRHERGPFRYAYGSANITHGALSNAASG